MEDPQALMRQAEASLSKGSGWGLFKDRDGEYMTAAQLFREAAQAYERQGQNIQAGKAFERSGEVQEAKLKEVIDAADRYTEASDAYRKDDPQAAIRCREYAFVLVQRSSSENKQTKMSRIKDMLGQIYEKDLKDLKKARESYKEAAERLPRARELNANKLWLQYADLAAVDEDYYAAIETYERIINSMVSNATSKYILPTYCFKALICHLATGDTVATRRAVDSYRANDTNTPEDRESAYQTGYLNQYQLIRGLCDAVDGSDQGQFATLSDQFNKTRKLDEWEVVVLLRAKEKISGQVVKDTGNDEEPDNEFV